MTGHVHITAAAVPGGRDASAWKKGLILRDRVVRPALLGDELAFVRQLLAEILQGLPRNVHGHRSGRLAVVQRIFWWIRGRIRYVQDPVNRELFQTFRVTVSEGLGDCDDFTTAIAVLCKAAGIPVRARIIATQPGGPWVHIYPLADVGGRWIPLDATENYPPGWQARYTRHLDIDL